MRLLIATGGSPHSENAMQLGAQILRARAHHFQAELHQPSPSPLPAEETPTVLMVIRREAERARAEVRLNHHLALLGESLPLVSAKIRVGHRADEILREATTGRYGLVILGKRPAHRLVTRFIGSTATRVIENAPCPVLVAKGQVRPIRRILLCDSGAQSPVLLDSFKRELGELVETKAEVTVLHVMSQIGAAPGVRGQQLRAEAEALMQAGTPEGELLAYDLAALQRINVRPQPKVRHGPVVNEIIKEAQQGDYDLVAIGASCRQGWWSILLENLERQVIAQIDRPVLVVR
ncbi:MAG TPA: universal stress protein [Anaerolineae bacterium]|nr:universal stress protein [Anaerolineae bacterium]